MTGELLADRQSLLWLLGGIAIIVLFVVVFATLAVTYRVRNHRMARTWARLEAEWDPLIMEVLYGDAGPAVVWDRVRGHHRPLLVDYLLRYARRLAGEERQRLCDIAAPYLPMTAVDLHRRSAERRARAVLTLGELGMPAYGPDLVAALDDSSLLVSMTAARCLARPEHPQFTGAVMNHLHRFTHWRANFLAAMLAAMGPAAAPAIRLALADRARAGAARVVAALALRQLSDSRAGWVAAEIVRFDVHRDTVAAALRLLARVGRPEDVSLVRHRLRSTDEVVRGAAAEALGYLGDASDVDTLQAVAADDPSRWVAISAARAVRELGGQLALRRLGASTHARASLALQVLAEAGA